MEAKYQRDYKFLQLPGLIIMAAIFLIPMVTLVRYSTLQYKMSAPKKVFFIGIQNYYDAFHNKEFLSSIWTTLKYIFFALIIETPLSLLIMEIICCLKRFREVVKTLFLPPMIIPPIVSGVIWRMMFQPSSGVLNYFLSYVNLQPQWLTSASTAMLSVVLVDVWAYTPFLLIVLLSGRTGISIDLYEASMIDGAGRVRQFFSITLPLLRNTIILGLLFRVTDCLKVFPSIHMLTAGGPGISTQTINYYTYRQAFNYGNYGYASALGVILLLLAMLLAAGLILSGGRRSEE